MIISSNITKAPLDIEPVLERPGKCHAAHVAHVSGPSFAVGVTSAIVYCIASGVVCPASLGVTLRGTAARDSNYIQFNKRNNYENVSSIVLAQKGLQYSKKNYHARH